MQVRFEGDNVIISKTDFIKYMNDGKPLVSEVTPIIVDKETFVTDYLLSKGIKRHLKGFKFIRDTILLGLEDPDVIERTCELYSSVADMNSTTSSKCERAIRHAITVAYGKDKPKNSEFIATVTDDIRLRFK